MSRRPTPSRFAARPSDPDGWVRSSDGAQTPQADAVFTARLTIDVTPALRGRIKIAAFNQGLTVAAMLRDLLGQAFPPADGDEP